MRINRQARHGFWTRQYRADRAHQLFWAIVFLVYFIGMAILSFVWPMPQVTR